MSGGRLIVFEGCYGIGKCLQARLLAEALRRAGVEVLETAGPARGPCGQKIRERAGARAAASVYRAAGPRGEPKA